MLLKSVMMVVRTGILITSAELETKGYKIEKIRFRGTY